MRPDLAKKLEPTFTGWIGHENPFGFEIGATRYTPTIYRFTQGTPEHSGAQGGAAGTEDRSPKSASRTSAEKSKCQTALLMDLASTTRLAGEHAA